MSAPHPDAETAETATGILTAAGFTPATDDRQGFRVETIGTSRTGALLIAHGPELPGERANARAMRDEYIGALIAAGWNAVPLAGSVLWAQPKTLADRVSDVLRGRFPEHVPGQRAGWVVLERNGRWFVAWDLARKVAADTTRQQSKRRELAEALDAAGFALAITPEFFGVWVGDRGDAPRYTVADSGLPFGGGSLIVDTWTRVDVRALDDRDAAEEMAARMNEEQDAPAGH
ncbi:hypothetical protein [Actinacidiphila sp. bgisy160]|uniref:hypothetical protein n=1 Tax=Actinacidiphila sp. bgisy160 TaxID=3413796 RepID=UPI003D75FFB1